MPLVNNQIGAFQFLDLAGVPDTSKRQVTPIARPGVAGVTLVDEDRRGVPFVVRSRVDQVDLATAWATYLDYCELIGTDLIEMEWQDVTISSTFIFVAVMDVKLVRLHALRTAVGGLNSPSGAWLECEWTLLPVQYP
jgi:hypothetical protein